MSYLEALGQLARVQHTVHCTKSERDLTLQGYFGVIRIFFYSLLPENGHSDKMNLDERVGDTVVISIKSEESIVCAIQCNPR